MRTGTKILHGGIGMSVDVSPQGFDKWWRAKKIAAKYGMGVSTWWKLASSPEAPKAVRIGKRFTVWRPIEVEEFMEKIATGAIKVSGGPDSDGQVA